MMKTVMSWPRPNRTSLYDHPRGSGKTRPMAFIEPEHSLCFKENGAIPRTTGNAFFDSYVGSVWLFSWHGHGSVRQEGGLGPRQQGGGMAQFHRNVEVSLPSPVRQGETSIDAAGLGAAGRSRHRPVQSH